MHMGIFIGTFELKVLIYNVNGMVLSSAKPKSIPFTQGRAVLYDHVHIVISTYS